MALSKEQKQKVSQQLGDAIAKISQEFPEAQEELKAAGGFIWCKPCPYGGSGGCWAYRGDC